jgi:hypothetical protein
MLRDIGNGDSSGSVPCSNSSRGEESGRERRANEEYEKGYANPRRPELHQQEHAERDEHGQRQKHAVGIVRDATVRQQPDFPVSARVNPSSPSGVDQGFEGWIALMSPASHERHCARYVLDEAVADLGDLWRNSRALESSHARLVLNIWIAAGFVLLTVGLVLLGPLREFTV